MYPLVSSPLLPRFAVSIDLAGFGHLNLETPNWATVTVEFTAEVISVLKQLQTFILILLRLFKQDHTDISHCFLGALDQLFLTVNRSVQDSVDFFNLASGVADEKKIESLVIDECADFAFFVSQ